VRSHFRDILKSELAPYEQVGRVSFDGPEFDLQAEVATTIGMIIHELSTNAAKYGALSLSDGRIAIDWTVAGAPAEPAVALTWRESGGPQVQRQSHKGFGSTLIERLIVKQFRGTTTFDFAPDGLVFRATFTVPGTL
jgi:two-component sensor histidine kinase